MNISSILFIPHFWLNILDIYVNGFQSLLIKKKKKKKERRRVNSKNCICIHDYIVANTVRRLYLSRDALQLTVLNRHSSCGATHIQTALFYCVHVEHCHFFHVSYSFRITLSDYNAHIIYIYLYLSSITSHAVQLLIHMWMCKKKDFIQHHSNSEILLTYNFRTKWRHQWGWYMYFQLSITLLGINFLC